MVKENLNYLYGLVDEHFPLLFTYTGVCIYIYTQIKIFYIYIYTHTEIIFCNFKAYFKIKSYYLLIPIKRFYNSFS